MSERLPIFVVTGFLGSGKTTLLRKLLSSPELRDTAVIINELGEVALDHDLIAFSAEQTVVLPGGCVCCAIRGDVEKAICDLLAARDAGTVPAFSRIIIETTGIADPMPLLATLARSPRSLERLQRPIVLTVVDGILGLDTTDQQREAAKQVSHADVIVISKCDLARPTDIDALRDRLGELNPLAQIRTANLLVHSLAELFSAAGPLTTPVAATPESPRAMPPLKSHSGIRSLSIVLDRPLCWNAFAVWTTLLLHRHGRQILRIKGLLAIEGLPGPTVFQSAQHLVHPPAHLEEWPSSDHRSRIVFIVSDLDPAILRSSLLAFDHAARIAPIRPSDSRPVGAGGVIAGRPVRRPSAPSWIKG